jgi:ferredoxin-NADP reductase
MDRPLLQATLTRSIALSELTKHMEFEAQGLEVFDFIAGQFISVVVPNEEGKQLTRAYSLASPPRGDRSFDLCLNRVQDGYMSNYMCDLQPGATIYWHGAHGLFTIREPIRDSIFVATGTGIAPIRGMLHWLFADRQRHEGHEFWLIFGTRFDHSIYYRDEFERIEREHPNFHYVVTLSRGDESWQGRRGYVQDCVRDVVTSRPNNALGAMTAYICGLNAMVSANRELLKGLGWDRRQIVYERYD